MKILAYKALFASALFRLQKSYEKPSEKSICTQWKLMWQRSFKGKLFNCCFYHVTSLCASNQSYLCAHVCVRVCSCVCVRGRGRQCRRPEMASENMQLNLPGLAELFLKLSRDSKSLCVCVSAHACVCYCVCVCECACHFIYF